MRQVFSKAKEAKEREPLAGKANQIKADQQQDGQKMRTTKRNRRGGRKGEWAGEKSYEERMHGLQHNVTLWNFESEVERSRLISTFEQIQLHKIFGDALCDEMQPQKGIVTPLALEQLQSPHLMSWMMSLGEERLKELLARMLDLRKTDIIERLASSIFFFHYQHKSRTNFSTNSKYATWTDGFSAKLRKAKFGMAAQSWILLLRRKEGIEVKSRSAQAILCVGCMSRHYYETICPYRENIA